MEESNRDEEDPEDYYITLRVKKAQLSWSYLETVKKLEEIKDIIIKTRSEIERIDKEDPVHKQNYYKKQNGQIEFVWKKNKWVFLNVLNLKKNLKLRNRKRRNY